MLRDGGGFPLLEFLLLYLYPLYSITSTNQHYYVVYHQEPSPLFPLPCSSRHSYRVIQLAASLKTRAFVRCCPWYASPPCTLPPPTALFYPIQLYLSVLFSILSQFMCLVFILWLISLSGHYLSSITK